MAIFGKDWLEKCSFSDTVLGGGAIKCNETAMSWWRGNWGLDSEVFVNGKTHDPAVGVPALVKFYDSGKMESLEHYAFGKRACFLGEPSVINFWQNGETRKIQYKEDTKHINPTNGAPTTVNFKPDGTIESGISLSGGRVRILSGEETAEIMKNVRITDMARLCGSEVVICGLSNLRTTGGVRQYQTISP